ncbi:MAG: hypothetical protein J07HX5_00625 [halophilic archaeon J07HX5]|jgi:hypothetical protein|nr:MAG: hypothetical protein J07HX5_00625 [halophilic archaeon J07HX5]
MTQVCLCGASDTTLWSELLSRETSRGALTAYELSEPYTNTVALETVSLGAAVALLNDLNWHLARFVADALVLEPSVSETEWLSRELAAAIRHDEVAPVASGQYLKIYGVTTDPSSAATDGTGDAPTDTNANANANASSTDRLAPGAIGGVETADTPGSQRQLVEPMFVKRADASAAVPEYDLQPVAETVYVRVSKSEFVSGPGSGGDHGR